MDSVLVNHQPISHERHLMLQLVIMTALLFSGCASQNADLPYKQNQAKYLADSEKPPRAPYQRQATYNPDHYTNYQIKGTATLSGEAFLRTRGGEMRYAAGQDVWLIPATAYGKEFMEQDLWKARHDTVPPLDRRIYDALRTDQADSHGRFSFSEVPTGDYFVATTIVWEVPKYSKYGSSSSSTGRGVWQPVTLHDGDQKKIILTITQSGRQ